MATVRYSIRQKKWIVTWKSHGASLRHDCDSEQAALTVSGFRKPSPVRNSFSGL